MPHTPTRKSRDDHHTEVNCQPSWITGAYARRVRNFEYTKAMEDSQNQLSARDARAHFADVITRAQTGSPTIITRNGQAVAAVVPIEDFEALEDAMDRYFSQEADRDIAENPDAPTYSMSEVVATMFNEQSETGSMGVA